jgi:acetyl-CoA synthetase
MFGQTEINYVVGNCQAAWPVKPLDRATVSRSSVAVINDVGKR